jgi:hypothetical protein
MAVHNWKRVRSGTFHDFHTAWIGELRRALNTGLLPTDYYVMAEQVAGQVGPDVLALHSPDDFEDEFRGDGIESEIESGGGGLLLATAPPQVSIRSEATEALLYIDKQKTLVIRHSSGDRIVAMIEIVSPGNKQSDDEVNRFIHKAISALQSGIHLLVLDLFPPGRNDPQGLHGALWNRLGDEVFLQPADKPLTLAAYQAKLLPIAHVEPIAIGAQLPDMSLFLTADGYVNVPLETTYCAAYEGVPERWRRVIEDR